ncbi:hypothetical protein HPB50_008770 [Hyalomma asiaticum]|uniref:Uncharacterized protein n=1 Tax=Hyalomma asiaticum TaxID=266040 RepID=A0ACB7SA79_HYAAI|nr:hypothetical protein HPB50_008770 [Hyalomma asiaticum]
MNAFYRHLRSALRCLPSSTRTCVAKRAMRVSAKLGGEEQDLDNGASSDAEELDSLFAKYPYKTVLVPDVADMQLQRLLSSRTPSELFSSVSELGTPCPLVYAAQAVVSLWDLKKVSGTTNEAFDIMAALSSPSFDALELLPSCSTEQDLKFAAISLRRLHHLSSPSLIAAFCNKASEILTPASHIHTFLRSLPVICHEPQHSFHDSCMTKVLGYLDPLIASLDAKDLASVSAIVSDTNCNAGSTIKLIRERARELCKEEPSVLTVRSLVLGPRLQHPERRQIEGSLHQFLTAGLPHHTIMHFADIVVSLPVTSFSLLTTFWNAAADMSNPSLMILIRRYFSCYQKTRFRSESFESVMLEWSKEELDSSWKLAAVALAAQFVLTFRLSELSSENIHRLSSLRDQFSTRSLLELSLGLRAAEQLSFSKLRRTTTLTPMLMYLKTDIHRGICKRVETVQDLAELTMLVVCNKVLWSSKGHNIHLKECVASRCTAMLDSASPRSLAVFCKALTMERLWLPECLNWMVAHAVEKPDWLFPITLCHLPYACFISGLVPDKAEQLARVVSSFVLRDFDDLPTADLLQAAVSLGFFQCLRNDLIHRIFSLPFMERLDRELTGSVGNKRADQHVRDMLAMLNRIVCLDFPEEHVPWFHDQFYTTRVLNARRHFTTSLQGDVQDNLERILGGSQFVQRHVFAPYSYHLDLSCELDASKKPVPFTNNGRKEHFTVPERQAPAAFHRAHKRIAVLVLGEKSFCENYPQIMGYQQLKIRHLEILGYQLVLVPFYEWNSMKLAEPSAKQDYLRGKIFGVS